MAVMVSGRYLKTIYLSSQKFDLFMLGFWFVVVLLACFIYAFHKFENFSSRSAPSFSDGGIETLRNLSKFTQLGSWKLGRQPGLAVLSAPQLCHSKLECQSAFLPVP